MDEVLVMRWEPTLAMSRLAYMAIEFTWGLGELAPSIHTISSVLGLGWVSGGQCN